jgi:uncharacterized LabA/DUF88 family protein
MVMLQANYDTAVIVSGDQDYVPAAQAVKNLGKHVINVAFMARNGVLLPGGAKRLNQVTDWGTALEWAECKQLLRLPDEPQAESKPEADAEDADAEEAEQAEEAASR